MTNDMTGWTATELRQAIGAKDVSPVEVLAACMERIERINPYVNAVTATCFERAKEEATAAEARVLAGEPLGILEGLPIGIKDLEETQDVLTTFGSPLYRSHVPTKDNSLVRLVRQAGAIVVGKTNVPELGAGAITRNPVWGATGNPFNPELNAGGSSGGSAVTLATNMLPLCTGSDTGGSLRIPAAKCGVIGFRTSPGLVPLDRRALAWSPISVVGPMGRTIDDVALQLAATARFDAADPMSYGAEGGVDLLRLRGADLSQLRVAWTEDFGVCDVDTGIRGVFRAKIAAMKHLFKSCDEVKLELGDADRCFDVIRAANYVARYSEHYNRDPDSLGLNVRANYEIGAQMTLAEHTAAHLAQTRMFRTFQQLYANYDIVLAPTTPVSPFPWTQLALREINGKALENYYRWLSLTYVVTLLTNPALSMPCGLDHRQMPFGMQVVGRFRKDHELLAIAKSLEWAWERNEQLKRPRPDIDKLLSRPPVDFRSIVTHPPLLSGKSASTEAVTVAV